jgi:RNA polymerase subunit RPABC4/transcription elongation factor Spt4
MGDLLNQITSLLGGIWDSPVVQLGLRAIAIYVVILWLAGAYWAFRDMQLRTANPLLPYFAASLVIIFTPVFFPFAIVAYRVVRPQEKIGEVYERTLAEEALLAEVEAVKSCPTCARRVDGEWIICPTCRTRLNRVCPNCSRLVGLDWSLCAWCGRDFERAATGPEASGSSRPVVAATSAGRAAQVPAAARAAQLPAAGRPGSSASSAYDDDLLRLDRVVPVTRTAPSAPSSGPAKSPATTGRAAADPMPEN